MAQASSRRFQSFRDYLKERHGDRVYRVDLASTTRGLESLRSPRKALPQSIPRSPRDTVRPEPITSTTRDELIRAMADLNHRYGARRFVVALAPDIPHIHPAEVFDWCQIAVALTPVVGLILVPPPSVEITSLVKKIRRITPQGQECWIELEVPFPAGTADRTGPDGSPPWTCFTRNVLQAQNASVPVIADLTLGKPNCRESEWIQAIRILNRLRVRSLRVHPYHVDAHEHIVKTNNTFSPVQFRKEDDYTAALGRLVDRLEPTMLLQGLGPRVSPQRILAPGWLKTPHDYFQNLERDLTARQSRQGRLYQNDRISSTP